MKKIVWVLFGIGISFGAWGQQRMSTAEYVDRYKDIAIEKMNTYGIPASITLAQGILESGTGNSELALKANNHFGIKCGRSWTGPTVAHDDDADDECFRKYASVEESYRDHSIFLRESKRYASLFELPKTDFEGWAKGLKAAGYATNPKYAEMLIDLIGRHKLYEYDIPQMAGGIFGAKVFVGEGNAPAPMMRVGLTWGRCNGVKYVVARQGDTYAALAEKLRIPLSRLLRLNDLPQTQALQEGERVYIQPKKGKSDRQTAHVVRSGETSHSISQDFGIKLSALKSKNRKLKKSPPTVGDTLKLK